MTDNDAPCLTFGGLGSYMPYMLCPLCGTYTAPSFFDVDPNVFMCDGQLGGLRDEDEPCHAVCVFHGERPYFTATHPDVKVPIARITGLVLGADDDDINITVPLSAPVWDARPVLRDGVAGFVTDSGIVYASDLQCGCAWCRDGGIEEAREQRGSVSAIGVLCRK
jgi:hypothetical protein